MQKKSAEISVKQKQFSENNTLERFPNYVKVS